MNHIGMLMGPSMALVKRSVCPSLVLSHHAFHVANLSSRGYYGILSKYQSVQRCR